MKDLIVLVADRNMEYAMKGILDGNKLESLKIEQISYDIFAHPEHDPGIYKRAHELLRTQQDNYYYGMVVFDKEGCGGSGDTESISKEVQENLDNVGWGNRSAVICIDPELEIWIWSDSPHVANCLGWESEELKNWLISNKFLNEGEVKPNKPKKAVEEALFNKRIPRSSSIYKNIALKVSFEKCNDRAFNKLKQTLQIWFPAKES